MYDPSGLYVDPILSNFAIGYKPKNLFGKILSPVTSVNTQSGRYRVFDRSGWLIYKSRREPGTLANEIHGRKWSEDEFLTKEHSLQAPVYDEEMQQLQSQGGLANVVFGGALSIDPERDATAAVVQSLDLEHEKLVADTFRDSSNYPTNHVITLVGNTQWSDYTGGVASTSNPISQLRTAVQRLHLDTGQWATDMVIPFDAVGVIEEHPRVVDRFKNWSLTIDFNGWKQLLGIPQGENFVVHMVDSQYNQADSVDAEEDIVSFWGQDIWLGIIDDRDDIDIQTFAKTFSQIYPGGTTRPTERWYDISIKTTKIRNSFKYDVKVVSGIAGYLFKNAVAAIV